MKFFDLFKKRKIVKANTAMIKQEESRLCENCSAKDICPMDYSNVLCNYTEALPNFDRNKKSILLLDDNPGIISILIDLLEELDTDGDLDLSKFNIISFSTSNAGFMLLASINLYKDLNIKYAIFDITLGGGMYSHDKGNIILDGIDAFEAVLKVNPDIKYMFFSGNNLNPYISKNKEIIEKFHDLTKKDIHDHIMYKTSLPPQERKKIMALFFSEE